MENILLVIHVIVALVIVGLIMLQQGKGAEMGASFGSGSSQTVFGSAGSGNFFSRMTGILVAVFFVTSFTLALIAKNRVEVDDIPLPSVEKVIDQAAQNDAEDEVPSLDMVKESAEDEIPSIDSAEALEPTSGDAVEPVTEKE